ncbi:MAG: hypothetical protein AAGC81_06420 [Pseudomonadota bacterium]
MISVLHGLAFLVFQTAIAALIIAIWKDLKNSAIVYILGASLISLLPSIILILFGAKGEVVFIVTQALAIVAGHAAYKASPGAGS